MLVETYETNEATGDSAALEDLTSPEALALIDALGLEGQREMIDERDAGDSVVVTRIPYRTMTAEERAVYAVVMPKRTRLAVYNSSAIPLRVLQVAAHAREMFDALYVWHPTDAKEDPILVGIKGSEYSGTLFLLARWGDVLLPFEELRALAAKKLAAAYKNTLAVALREVEDCISRADAIVEAHLMGEDARIPYVNVQIR